MSEHQPFVKKTNCKFEPLWSVHIKYFLDVVNFVREEKHNVSEHFPGVSIKNPISLDTSRELLLPNLDVFACSKLPFFVI